MELFRRLKKALKILLDVKDQHSSTKEIKTYARDYTAFENKVFKEVEPYTMTGHTRIINLMRSLDFLNKNNIGGSIVECGVWRGGSIMAAIKMQNRDECFRDIYLYDTFEGMSEPKDIDKNQSGKLAKDIINEDDFQKCISNLNEVKKNITPLDYSKGEIHYIKGKVEETIPAKMPKEIALLRLDTDWYESTLHELEHLFPLLVKGGILIIDDYGHWNGCREAVDEYFSKLENAYYMHRVDYTCRLIVK